MDAYFSTLVGVSQIGKKLFGDVQRGLSVKPRHKKARELSRAFCFAYVFILAQLTWSYYSVVIL
jgi:hypothetical protein